MTTPMHLFAGNFAAHAAAYGPPPLAPSLGQTQGHTATLSLVHVKRQFSRNAASNVIAARASENAPWMVIHQ